MDQLPTALTLLALALHMLGERRTARLTGRPRDRHAHARALTFYVALTIVLIALQSPLDSLSDELFWAHMLQHLLLMVVAAPLIVLSRPWMSMWRALPLSLRRGVARAALRSAVLAPVRTVFGALATPAGAWLAFNVNMVVWHMPGAYDLTLRNVDAHVIEHTLFLGLGILFWAQVWSLAPARSPLGRLARVGYVASAIIPNVGLSMFLAFAQHALYAPYTALAHRPGGISALADQQIGAGIMWTAGDLPYAVAIGVLFQRWLARTDTGAAQVRA